MKKNIIKIGAVLGIALTLSATPMAYAADWYSSTITLPRNDWWFSVQRKSTSSTQQTKVTKPTYDVVSNIARGNKDSSISTNQTHKSGQTDTRDHKTDVKGTNTRAKFRSSKVNQHTNTVKLAWRP